MLPYMIVGPEAAYQQLFLAGILEPLIFLSPLIIAVILFILSRFYPKKGLLKPLALLFSMVFLIFLIGQSLIGPGIIGPTDYPFDTQKFKDQTRPINTKFLPQGTASIAQELPNTQFYCFNDRGFCNQLELSNNNQTLIVTNDKSWNAYMLRCQKNDLDLIFIYQKPNDCNNLIFFYQKQQE